MSSQETLAEVRKAKHQELGGSYPLAEHSAYDVQYLMEHVTWAFVKAGTIDPNELGTPMLLHGRVSNFRKSGGITFIRMTDSTGSIQLILSKSTLPNYDKLRLIDLGDVIEITGQPCLSKTNEKSLLVSEWKVLTKALLPPPEKFIGIQDTELKYRKRYLDLMSSEESRARFIVRSYILRAIRQFMDERRFLEVETSTLASIASGANARPFTTHHNALDTELRLRIAPELNLKRLLVGGMDRVYEIGRAYRNEGIDTRHNPEFTILEFYQAYGKFDDLIAMTWSMLYEIHSYLEDHLPKNVFDFYNNKWREERSFSLSQYVEITMRDAITNACSKAGISLELNGNDINNVVVSLPGNDRLNKIDIKGMWHAIDNAHSSGEKIAALFEFVAEPFLTEDYRSEDDKHSICVFVTDYPKEISPLARPSDEDPSFTDRFELFVEGRELANAFQELNDPAEQERAFQAQLQNNQKDPMAYDHDYVEALEHGMPPAIGFGMGVDRLCMLLTGTSSIKDVILFPTLRPTHE